MTRLKELADALSVPHGCVIRFEDIEEAATILRAASAETVGTEWTCPTNDALRTKPNMTYSPFTWFASIRDEHNSDLLAARLAIAGLKAERDKAREDAAWWKDSVRECCNHALGTDRGNPDDRTIGTPVVLAVAEAVKQRTELVAKAQDLRASLEIALRERDAALASLAEKQRAIDEAVLIVEAHLTDETRRRRLALTLRPHATKATEASDER